MIFEEESWLDGDVGLSLEKSLFDKRGQKTAECTVKKKRARKRKKVAHNLEKEIEPTVMKTSDLASETSLKTSAVVEPNHTSTKKNKKPKKDHDEVTEPTISRQDKTKTILPVKNEWRKNKLAQMMGYTTKHVPVERNKAKGSHTKIKIEMKSKAIDISKTTVASSEDVTCRSKSSELSNAVTTKLQSAQFRFLNEQLYTRDSQGANKLFAKSPHSFTAYHAGFLQQVSKWPTNPLDLIISFLKKRPPQWIVGDFGCGDARLAYSVKNKVHSFDLVAVNEKVTVADISDVPLPDASLDVAVYCLSLMGTNYVEFLTEANRTLKQKGFLLVAEVTSRFQSVPKFLNLMKRLGFELKRQDRRNSHFLMFDFIKSKSPQMDIKIPAGLLKPCVYKKR